MILRSYRSAFSGLPPDLWILALVALVNRAGSMVLPFLSLYLISVRGLSAIEAGQILSLYGVGSILGSLVGGWLSDRLGPRRAQQLSLFFSGIGFLVLGRLESHRAIALGILITSTIVDSFRPACMSMFAERSPEKVRMRAFALLRLALNLGIGIAPAVGGILALYSYQLLFAVDAVTCWAAAGLLALPILTGGASARGHHPEGLKTDRPSPWQDGPFLALILVVVLLAASLFQFFSTFPVHLRETLGFREDAIGLIFALNPILIVIFEMVLIRAVEKMDNFRLVAAGAFLLCAGFGLIPFGESIWFICFTVVIWTVGEMLSLPVINSIVAERAPAAGRGRYMGLFTMSFSLGLVIAPSLGMYLWEEFGWQTVWFSVGLAGVPLAIGVLLLRRFFVADPRPRPAGPP
jgi:predicted MFS family arabinose efflux permease